MRRRLAAAAASVLSAAVLTLTGITTEAPASAATAVHFTVRTAIAQLPGAVEVRTGYSRDKFRLWIDANHDCQDTRDEVLAAESKVAVSGCDIRSGRWVSYYDRKTYTTSSGLDIDHLVPLAEVWDSGGRRWNADTRTRYANDLGDSRTLVAVTAAVNRCKGDQDPADWQPTYGKCRYVDQWVAVKLRWGLSVDARERRALTARAKLCPNITLTVTKAKIVDAAGTTGSGPSGTDPRFDYCYQAVAAGYGPYYQGRDPGYAWYRDSDGDGVVCEH